MSCEERGPDIFLYAAGALEGEQARELAAHLRGGCGTCEAELAAAEATLAELSSGLDPVEPSPDVRARLMARVAGGQARPRAGTPARSAWARLAIAAGLGALVAAGLTAGLIDRFAAEPLRTEIARLEAEGSSLLTARRELEERLSELLSLQAEQDSELADLEGALALRDELVQLLRAPDLEMRVLAAAPARPGAWARIFWEWEDYACYLEATGLAALPQGRAYVLWLLTEDGRWVRAGELSPGASGQTSFFTRLSRDTGRVKHAQITLESGPDAAEPSAEVQLSSRPL